VRERERGGKGGEKAEETRRSSERFIRRDCAEFSCAPYTPRNYISRERLRRVGATPRPPVPRPPSPRHSHGCHLLKFSTPLSRRGVRTYAAIPRIESRVVMPREKFPVGGKLRPYRPPSALSPRERRLSSFPRRAAAAAVEI